MKHKNILSRNTWPKKN